MIVGLDIGDPLLKIFICNILLPWPTVSLIRIISEFGLSFTVTFVLRGKLMFSSIFGSEGVLKLEFLVGGFEGFEVAIQEGILVSRGSWLPPKGFKICI